ncbi:hypothetical protein PISL3812_07892 [Talaromyces islandicus]|uniref:Uncharacterized protein n=1 Tax=Talaromyces islandicus TaxID=28573 RepID=A0A0U1M7F4_TALIS|nr:hypothetical protein PISL3812_07892 [Talaromyces islandicus]
MVRAARFSENFEYTTFESTSNILYNEKADVHPAAKPRQACLTGKTMKSLIMAPYHGLCALTNCYKQHLSIMFHTNRNCNNTTTTTSSTEKLVRGYDNVEAGSTAYGLQPASDEELRRQSKRSHVDYVFGLGPDAYSINNTATTTTTTRISKAKRSTATNTKSATTADIKPRTPDARTCWNQVYLSDTASEIANINTEYHNYLFSLGYTPEEAMALKAY